MCSPANGRKNVYEFLDQSVFIRVYQCPIRFLAVMPFREALKPSLWKISVPQCKSVAENGFCPFMKLGCCVKRQNMPLKSVFTSVNLCTEKVFWFSRVRLILLWFSFDSFASED